jgi:mitogen-activated protein kinase kinase kinase 9
MEFNSERLIPKGKYFDQSNSGEISKDLNYNEIDKENQNGNGIENENEEEIQANLIFTWGFSKYGQTGFENTNYILSPSIINFSQIINSEQFSQNIEIEPYCGESHSAFLIKEQEQTFLYMFGKNIFGQLGFGENSYIFEPLLVPDIPEKIKKISLGGEHSIILTTKNNIFVSGLNIFGQLGTGDYDNRNVFTNIDIYKNTLMNKKDEKIVDISAGAQHSLLLSNKNNLYYCGFNKNNFLNKNEDINIFTQIIDEKIKDKKIKHIRTGMNINGILFEDKLNIAIFGQELEIINKTSEIILLNIKDIIKEEYRKDNTLNISDIKLGQEFILILISNGDVYTCGINRKNKLGVEEKNIKKEKNKLIFYKVSLPEKIIQIESGYDSSIVISETGKIYGWGSNYYGQICSTKKSTIDKPILITNPLIKDLSLYKIASGAYHTLSIYKGDVNNIPEEEPIFDVFKAKLFSIIETSNQDQEKALDILLNQDKFNNELNIKQEDLKKKMEELKEKIRKLEPENSLSKFNRGFENNFEISLEELEFDEENNEIGKGTFGDVLRGTWRGEEVAVKFLKGSMTESSESVKQFLDECNILKNLHHPNILLYMGACTIGPQYFVVTEFCDNGNLFEFLHMMRDTKLTYNDARRIALEIAYGMNYLHGFKPPILHRDLKSMNVLLDRNCTVKLADFGNTRTFQIQMTKQKGTFQWMAPEVIKGNTYSESSDVFSFGIIMNELVTRIPPYHGTDKKDVAKKVVNNPNYRPPYNEKKVPKDWIDIMTKCWQHDEKKRPNFGEVIELLLKAKLPGNVMIKQPTS